MLLSLTSLWIKNDIIGAKWNILQIKIYDNIPILDECMIIDSDEEEKDNICKYCRKRFNISKLRKRCSRDWR